MSLFCAQVLCIAIVIIEMLCFLVIICVGSFTCAFGFHVLTTAESTANVWPVKFILAPPTHCLRLLSVLGRWFLCCLFIVYCCPHCLWGFVLVPCFDMQYIVFFLDLKSSRLGRVCWLLYLCLLGVIWLLSFFASSSRRRGLVCSVCVCVAFPGHAH